MHPVAKCTRSPCSIVEVFLHLLQQQKSCPSSLSHYCYSNVDVMCHVTRSCNVIRPHRTMWQDTTCICSSPDLFPLLRKLVLLVRVAQDQVPIRTYYLLLHLQLTFLECTHFTKVISSALSAISNILHSSGTQFVYLSLSYYCIHSSCMQTQSLRERGYANCNSTYLVKASALSGMRLAALKTAVRSCMDVQIEPSAILLHRSRVELHPLAHAQFASLRCVQRPGPKKGASDKNSQTGALEARAPASLISDRNGCIQS